MSSPADTFTSTKAMLRSIDAPATNTRAANCTQCCLLGWVGWARTCGFHMCSTGTLTAAAAAATLLSCVSAAQRTPSAAAAEGPKAVKNTTTANTTTNTTAAFDMLAIREGSRTMRLTGRAPTRVTPVM